MLKKELVTEHEEQLRVRVRALSDEQRRAYFAKVEKKLKDPDTYATLNYIFIAGLHHFYLGKWPLGLVNIACFWGGVGLLIAGWAEAGVALLIGIAVFELYELFRAQIIVQNHNNLVSQDVLASITSDEASSSAG